MGNLALAGATSGTITLTPAAVAGTNTITLPASTGTMALTASPTFSGTVTATTITSPSATALTLQYGGTTGATLDTSGNLQFNSGYGSVATAYGCRAWVNFNGSGTVAIRASGNVSSITDNGAGDYTVNMTNAMPDTNYAFVGNARKDNDTFDAIVAVNAFQSQTKTTSALRFYTVYRNNNASGFGSFDSPEIDILIVR
jgi:hypothetical protein